MIDGHEDPYDILGVEKNATSNQIKTAYKKLAKQLHPDICTDIDKELARMKMDKLNKAYNLLGDEEKRR